MSYKRVIRFVDRWDCGIFGSDDPAVVSAMEGYWGGFPHNTVVPYIEDWVYAAPSLEAFQKWFSEPLLSRLLAAGGKILVFDLPEGNWFGDDSEVVFNPAAAILVDVIQG